MKPKHHQIGQNGTKHIKLKSIILQSLKFEVFDWVNELLIGTKPITIKTIFKCKFDSNGNFMKYKCRTVGRGFTQTLGMDFFWDKTYAPVLRLEMLRILIVLSFHLGLTM